MLNEFQKIREEYQDLLAKVSRPDFIRDQEVYVKSSKRLSKLSVILEKIDDLEKLSNNISQNRIIIQESLDKALADLAEEESGILIPKAEELKKGLNLLIQRLDDPEAQDEEGIKEAILEIRAGTGGDEAALFAADLFKMYRAYTEKNNWEFKMISESRDELGGYKEVICEIKGKRVFSLLKYESGVHRVQRIPETEKAGRIHTSTATVAVMPVLKDVKLEISEKDLEIVFFRSSSAGGQNVNKVETAVRIKHSPSGIVVSCQSERYQHQNKERALGILKAKILDIKRREQMEERVSERRSQIGTGERSEKIRTYNFPQDRITDHRINQSWKNISRILAGDLEIINDEVTKQLG
ncbi:MAG: Peptide chain release factor 1 [Parcubacteria group bacterium GW2011_GWB1_41_4]|nr:MAG: Peptide chain release factor 1 [Parcubacteria group bacterium GW2011_GWB1_41_4]